MNIKRFFVNLGFYLYVQLRIYKYWSKLYRLIWERKYRNVALPVYHDIQQLVNFISTLTWVADGPKELFDAVSSPQKVEWIGRLGDRKVGDCDEFAIYITNALSLNKEIGTLQPFAGIFPIKEVYFMTVPWAKGRDGKAGGHNVCLIEWALSVGTGFSYMDYGFPSLARSTIREVVRDVRVQYAGQDDQVGYSLHDRDLNVVKVSWS